MEIFSLYQKLGLHPFRQTSGPDLWDLRERYGGSNLGEKAFKLFQIFIDRLQLSMFSLRIRPYLQCLKIALALNISKVFLIYSF